MPVYATHEGPDGLVYLEPIIPAYETMPWPSPFFHPGRKPPTQLTLWRWKIRDLIKDMMRGHWESIFKWPKRQLQLVRYRRRRPKPKKVIFKRILRHRAIEENG